MTWSPTRKLRKVRGLLRARFDRLRAFVRRTLDQGLLTGNGCLAGRPRTKAESGRRGDNGHPVTRDDMYLTIRPALKKILDRMEARAADSPDKVLMSSATDMEASRIETSLPEFRDRVVRRPRQFWDITVMLNEPTPRIRTLGTALIQRGGRS